MNHANLLSFKLVAIMLSISSLKAMEGPEEPSKNETEINIMDIPSNIYSQSTQQSDQHQDMYVSEINDKDGYIVLTIKKENGDLASYKVKLANKEIGQIADNSNPNPINDTEIRDTSVRTKMSDFLKKHGYIAPWGILTSIITFNVLSILLKYLG
jgi:hypothetical protein